MPCRAPIKAAGTLWRALHLHVRLYNRRWTFQSEWRTDNPRCQSGVAQEHDARRQWILRLPRHDAKYFTYGTWVFHRWVNWSPTYHRVQDNATGYGKMPIIWSTKVQCWTPAGGPQHDTRHSIYKMSKLHQWMNFRRTIWTKADRTMPGANHSGRLLRMPINPILGKFTGRSRRQHMRCRACMK